MHEEANICQKRNFKHEILKKFPCHYEKSQKDETQCQWLNKEINRTKRKMYLIYYRISRVVGVLLLLETLQLYSLAFSR